MGEGVTRRSILVVDDEDSFRNGIAKVIKKAGFEVIEASNAPDAILMCSKMNFDLIISDIRMPEMSGLDFVHILHRLIDDPNIIMLTAVADPEERLENLTTIAGVSAYLNKPVTRKLLLNTIEETIYQYLVKNKGAPQLTKTTGISSTTSEKTSNDRSILLVSKELQGFNTALEKEGYLVLTAKSAREAILYVSQEYFDAIILDMHISDSDSRAILGVLSRICNDAQLIVLADGTNKYLPDDSSQITFLEETCSPQLLQDTLSSVFTQHQDFTQNIDMQKENEGIVAPPLAEIEDIINNHDESFSPPEFSLETSSHRMGESLFCCMPEIKQEIENVLLRPNINILSVTPDQYVDHLCKSLEFAGWERGQYSSGKLAQRSEIDIQKSNVGIKFGIDSANITSALYDLYQASQSCVVDLLLGVYIVGTTSFQKFFKKETGKTWSGACLHHVIKEVRTLGRGIELPICIIGLGIVEPPARSAPDLPSYARNVAPVPYSDCDSIDALPELLLTDLTLHQIKERVFDYLEMKYQQTISRNIQVQYKTIYLCFDGIMYLNTHVILEIAIGESHGNILSRLMSDTTWDPDELFLNYKESTSSDAVLRFILLGDYRSGFLRDLNWRIENIRKNNVNIMIDYQVLSFDTVGIIAYEGMQQVYMGH